MIFIWSSEGGPLQYVGLVLFVIQILPLNLALGFLTAAVAYRVATGSQETSLNRVVAQCREWIQTTASELSDNKLVLFLSSIGVVGILILTRLVGSDVAWTAIHLAALIFIVRLQAQGRHQVRDERSNEERMTEIVKMIQVMPIEDFVQEEKISSSECSISQLKRMLEIRGKNADDFVERKNLEDAVKECRNYSETCCICYEDYKDDDLLRVLPKCRHEFHVECCDKWAYTFANTTKREQEPTCPLCNTPLR